MLLQPTGPPANLLAGLAWLPQVSHPVCPVDDAGPLQHHSSGDLSRDCGWPPVVGRLGRRRRPVADIAGNGVCSGGRGAVAGWLGIR